MATIIAVHGTNASGPEEGAKWWQKGSAVEGQLLERVESERGALTVQPFVWDGRNSEMSRRKASSELLQRALELEGKGEPYCLVGHSHGGSVIELALFQAASRGNSLPNLKRWISVATPFVVSRRAFFLFSRLGPIGKAIYLAWMMLVATSVAFLVLAFSSNPQTDQEGLIAIVEVAASISFAVCAIVFYFFLRALERRNPIRRKKKFMDQARTMFAGRWTSLWHKHDEAMQGLAALKKLRVNLFARDYAVEPLSLIGAFLLPLAAMLTLISTSFRSFAWSSLYALSRPLPISILSPLAPGTLPSFLEPLSPLPEFVLVGMLLIAGLSIAAVSIVVVVRAVSFVLSLATSGHLNSEVHEQVKRSSLGGDVLGERAIGVIFRPEWAQRQFAPLPDALGGEIAQFCDREVQRAIPKLRQRMASLALAKASVFSPDALAADLSWNELIHTSYFELERFCKLLAYAVSKADGFGATAVFKADPDYALAAKWFEEIQPKASVEMDAAASKDEESSLKPEPSPVPAQ